MIVNSRRYLSKVSYLCDDGYMVQGLISRLCEASGVWSGEDPVCVRKYFVPSCTVEALDNDTMGGMHSLYCIGEVRECSQNFRKGD